MLKAILLSIFLASSTLAAKTDLAGCTLTIVPLLTEIVTATGVDGVVHTVENYESTTFLWDGTEQCQLLDCGGGRAPPKTDAPGCPGYTGTSTVPSLPFPTASLTLVQAGATSASMSAPGPSAAFPGDAPATTGPITTTSLSDTATSTLRLTPSVTAATTGTVTQVSDLNPTATRSPNNALSDGARLNTVMPRLAAVALAALYLP